MANTDISGVVTDDDDNPVYDATVYLWREDLPGTREQVLANTTTNVDGEYEFDIHPDGTADVDFWHVAAKKDGVEQINFKSVWGVIASISGQNGLRAIEFTNLDGTREAAFSQLGFEVGGTTVDNKQSVGFQ